MKYALIVIVACSTIACTNSAPRTHLSDRARTFVESVEEDATGFSCYLFQSGYRPGYAITLMCGKPGNETANPVIINHSQALRIAEYFAEQGLLDKPMERLPYGKVVGWYIILSSGKTGIGRFIGLEKDALLKRPDILGVRKVLSGKAAEAWDKFIGPVRQANPRSGNSIGANK